jgi:hypothetical protein
MANQKTKQQTNPPAHEPKVGFRRLQDLTVQYADGARFSISAYDIKITFQVTETLVNNDSIITEFATIALSPAHAKDFAETLLRNVKRYEQDIMPLEIRADSPYSLVSYEDQQVDLSTIKIES